MSERRPAIATLAELARSDLPTLERLYRDTPIEAPLPTGTFNGRTLGRIRNAGANQPVARFVEWVGFELLLYGMNLDIPSWTFLRARVHLGDFVPTRGPSRWRDTETYRLDYKNATLPGVIKKRLYDELKPLGPDLLLGIGGLNGGEGEGDHFFYAMARARSASA